MRVSHIPKGYHSITPYLIVKGANDAINFYKTVFGATEIMRIGAPGNKVGHAELKIGDSIVMLADEFPEMGHYGPQASGSPVGIMVYVEDVDAVAAKAVAAGAMEKQAVSDKFYGDRSGTYSDPFGHSWTISTHKEDVSPEEMRRRAEAAQRQS